MGAQQPHVRFLTTDDGVRIAYAEHGAGPPLVFVRGWISHLEHLWQDGDFRAYFEALGQHCRVIRYDARSNGLSDWDVGEVDLDALVTDLEALMDTLALERATIYGQCFGGPIAIAYAARHPDRVERLILDGTYATGRRITSPERQARLLATMRDLPEAGLLLMSYYTTPEPRPSKFRQLGGPPTAISPATAARLYQLAYQLDVSPLLAQVRAPCLVMHREETRAIPLRLGRELAAGIANARFVALKGAPHNPWEGDAAEPLAAIGEFLGVRIEPRATRSAERAAELRSILFTDMESSTALTQRLGDAGAQDLVRAHNQVVREALRAHDGREIKHTGDGIMASFASASQAVACAIAIQRAVAASVGAGDSFRVRIGLNAGEPVAEEDDLFGTAVQLAKRACDAAAPGQILASNVVRELCAGKGFAFEDRGQAALKGFAEPVRVYEVTWGS